MRPERTYVYVNTRSIQNKNDIYPECVSLFFMYCVGWNMNAPGARRVAHLFLMPDSFAYELTDCQ